MTRLERIKVSSVFIGAIVGAGFATGKEIILFFGNGGFVAPLVTGIAMGLCAVIFLYVGKIISRLKENGSLNKKAYKVVSFALFAIIELCMLLTMTAMIGGMQKLAGDLPWQRAGGFFIAALCIGLSSLGAKAVRRINLALVPVLFVLLSVLFCVSSKEIKPLPFDLKKSAGYLSMNMLLGGCLAVKDGEKASSKDILKIGATCATVLGIMTFFVYSAASDYPQSDMPVYSLCAAHGLKAAGALAVGIAILTTLAGAAKSLGDGIYAVFPSKAGVTAVLMLLALASYGWDFANAVNLFYPFIAAVASGVFILVFLAFVMLSVAQRIMRQKRKRYDAEISSVIENVYTDNTNI